MRSKYVVAALSGLFMAGVAFAQAAPVAAPPAPDPQNILNIDLSTGGRVKVLLRPDKAPYSVDRIKILTRRHFYDGLIFHRVIEGFMAQGGDPKGTGEGGSDLPDLKAEFNDLPHVRGTMSLARADGLDTANSQFFLMLQPNLNLDGSYTAIGRVIAGMEYADAIERGEPPEHPSKIVHMSIESDDEGMPPVAFVPPPPAAPVVVAPFDAKRAQQIKKQEAKRDKRQAKETAQEEKKKAKQTKQDAKDASDQAADNAKRAAKVAPAAPAAAPLPAEIAQPAPEVAPPAPDAAAPQADASVPAAAPAEMSKADKQQQEKLAKQQAKEAKEQAKKAEKEAKKAAKDAAAAAAAAAPAEAPAPAPAEAVPPAAETAPPPQGTDAAVQAVTEAPATGAAVQDVAHDEAVATPQ